VGRLRLLTMRCLQSNLIEKKVSHVTTEISNKKCFFVFLLIIIMEEGDDGDVDVFELGTGRDGRRTKEWQKGEQVKMPDRNALDRK
jgi:hypothetical protein